MASIGELLGGYAEAQVHAGAVSLGLTGKGHGWSLGIDFGELKIER